MISDLSAGVRKNAISFIVTIGAVFLLAVYLFVYVPSNEKKIFERNFRELKGMAKNLDEKYKSLLKAKHKNSSVYDSTDAGILFSTLQNSDSANDFFADLIEGESFNQLVVLNTISKATVYATEVPYPELAKLDTLTANKSFFSSGLVLTQTIYGEQYSVFILPFALNTDRDLLLCGLVSQSRIKSEKFSFPGSYVLFLLTIILYFIIALPFLKLVLLNENELLSKYDLLFGLLGLIIGLGLTIFLIFDTYEFGIKEPDRRDHTLEGIANKISTGFENEIVSVIHQLKESDSIAHIKFNPKDSLIYLHTDYTNGKKDTVTITYYPNFIRTNWYNPEGKLIQVWQHSTDSIASPIGKNFKERNYFKALKENKHWQINHPYDSLQFGFQPLYSWIDKKFYTDISIESKNIDSIEWKPYAADITALMRSVTNTVLPPGYGFSIVNENGDVKYHSNMQRNLRENILSECDYNEILTEALQTNSPRYFSASYERKPQRFYIKPIAQLPLFICVFYNEQTGYGTNLHIFSFYIIFLSALILLALIILSVLLARRYKKYSQLHRSKINIDWLWPKASLTEMYLGQILLNCILSAFTLILVLCPSFKPIAGFGILAYNVLFTCFAYYVHFIHDFDFSKPTEEKNKKENDKLSEASIFLQTVKSKIFPAGTFVFLFAAIFWLVFYFTDVTGRIIFSFYIVLSVIAFVLILKGYFQKIRDWLSSAIDKVSPKAVTHLHCYSLMIFSWAVLCFGISSVKFFRDSFNLELVNMAEYEQYNAAKAITENKKTDDPVFKTLSPQQKASTLLSGVYLNESIHTSTGEHSDSGYVTCNSFCDQRNFDSLTALLRMRIGWISDDLQIPFIKNNITDSSRYTYSYNKDSRLIQLHYQNPILRTGDDSILNEIHIHSDFPAYRFLSLEDADSSLGYAFPILMWVAVITFLLLVFRLVYYFVRRVFDYSKYSNATDALLMPPKIDKHVVVLNLKEFSEPDEKFLKLHFAYDPEKIKPEQLNFTSITEEHWKHIVLKAVNSESENLLVRNFDFNIYDGVSNDKRIQALHSILESKKKKIVIVTAVNPLDFEKIILNNALCYDKCKLTYFQQQTEAMLGNALFLPENFSGAMPNFKFEKRTFLKEAIVREVNYSPLLKNYIREIIHTCGEIAPDKTLDKREDHDCFKEQVIIRTQVLAQLHYRSIWNNLSRDEQFFLFDFAKDGLLNFKNSSVIKTLSHKGILIVDNEHRRKIFNNSFRNFCLESLDKKQRQEFKEYVQSTGSWSKFKKPLLIAIMFITLFIFITQQESFNTMIALLTSFTAGIPVIMRLFTMFEAAGIKNAK